MQAFDISNFLITSQEWPEEEYPVYANGPGYVISSDIAAFVLSAFRNKTLRVRYYNYLLKYCINAIMFFIHLNG
jgi:hypothetical protein